MARVPLQRVIRIATFRSQLRSFLRHSERRCLSLGLTPQRFVLLLLIDGAPDGSRRATRTVPMPASNRFVGMRQWTIGPFAAIRMRPARLVDEPSVFLFAATAAFRRAAFAASLRWRCAASAMAESPQLSGPCDSSPSRATVPAPVRRKNRIVDKLTFLAA